jgi:pyroglutamyl-peptidase
MASSLRGSAADAADPTPPLDDSTITNNNNNNNNNDNNNDNHAKVSFIITGFGPFGNIQENPSTILVTELAAYLATCGKDDLAARIAQTKIMETSVQDVRATLDGFYEESSNKNNKKRTTGSNSRVIIYLHIGVNYMGTGMQLEQCAYNEATFRIPDQQGFQPQSELVVETNNELGAIYQTTLDLESISRAQTQAQTQPTTTTTTTLEVKVSTNPGRFVCNYAYCYSLDKFQKTKEQPYPHHDHLVQHSLFLHVPTFQVVPQKQQLAYVADLLQRLAEQVEVKAKVEV